MPENGITDIKVQLESLKKDIEQVNGINLRIDTAIDKLTDVSASIKSMLAVHEEKLDQSEKIDEVIFTKIRERLNNKKILNHSKFLNSIISKNNIHNIQKMMLTNGNNLCLSPAWNMCFSNDNNLYINSYHNTPIAFRTELLPKKIIIEISSDQDFTDSLYNNLEHYSECYFVKDSFETLIISLKSIKDEPLEIAQYVGKQNDQNIMTSAKTWIQNFTNNFHKYSSNFVYVIHITTKKKDKNIFNQFENLNEKLLS